MHREAAMRMTIRVVLGVVTVALGTLLLLGIGADQATAAPARPTVAAMHVIHTATAPTTGTPATGATSTNYNQAQQAADAALVHRKLILAGICVVLLVIVYFGHKAKYKHILRVRSGKG
jgi:ABC-type transport system substrate-binding protein